MVARNDKETKSFIKSVLAIDSVAAVDVSADDFAQMTLRRQ
jgi:hypothetical protein